MYFWPAGALAQDLRAGRASERQRMWYLLGQTVMSSSTVPIGFEFALPVLHYWRIRTHLRWIAAAPAQ